MSKLIMEDGSKIMFKWEVGDEDHSISLDEFVKDFKLATLPILPTIRPLTNACPCGCEEKVSPTVIADVLDKAADLLEHNGWTQGNYENIDGALCSVGAIRKVVTQSAYNGSRASARSVMALEDHLNPGAPHLLWTQLIDWNDTPGRTMFEVIDLFRAVSKNLRNEASPE